MEISLMTIKKYVVSTILILSFPFIFANPSRALKHLEETTKDAPNLLVSPKAAFSREISSLRAVSFSESLAKAYLSSTDRFVLTAERVVGYEKSGNRCVLWIVSCSNSAGCEVASFRWNADSGELHSFTIESSYFVNRYGRVSKNAKPMPRSKAAELGDHLLLRISPRSFETNGTLRRTVTRTNKSLWRIEYCSVEKKIQIIINSYTGDAMEARVVKHYVAAR